MNLRHSLGMLFWDCYVFDGDDDVDLIVDVDTGNVNQFKFIVLIY